MAQMGYTILARHQKEDTLGGIRQDRIKALRKRRGMRPVDLAALCGITEAYMYRIESNHPPNVGSSTVIALAQALNTSTDFLLGVTDDPTPPIPNIEEDPEIREVARAVQGKLEELKRVAPYLLDSAANLLYMQLEAQLAAVRQEVHDN